MNGTTAQANWTTALLVEVAEIERSAVSPENIESGTTYVGLENITSDGGFINVGKVTNGQLASTKFKFTPLHILYGKLRPYLAKIARPDFEGVCSTDILPILPGPKVNRGYLLHFLRRPEMVSFASSRTSGANLPRLSPNELAAFRIPLPPLPEQKRIADILDKADSLRRKRQEARLLTQNMPLSAFRETFRDYLNPDAAQYLLSDAAEVVSGVAKGRKLNGAVTRLVPYLRVANVQAGYLDLSEIKTIPAKESEIKDLALQHGDVVMTEGGDHDKLGRGALWEHDVPDCIHQNHVFRVRTDRQKLLPTFFVHYLQTELAKGYFLRCAKKTTNLASINMTQLRALPVPQPPLKLQQRFDDELRTIRDVIDRQNIGQTDADSLFHSLVQRAFKGEL